VNHDVRWNTAMIRDEEIVLAPKKMRRFESCLVGNMVRKFLEIDLMVFLMRCNSLLNPRSDWWWARGSGRGRRQCMACQGSAAVDLIIVFPV
jgi:hypothetical protein